MLPVLLAAAEETVDYTTTTDVATNDAAAGAIIAGFGAFMIVWMVVGIAFFAYWLWMLIDAIKTTDEQYAKVGSGSKIMWILLILLLGIIPAIIYHFMVKKKVKALAAPAKS